MKFPLAFRLNLQAIVAAAIFMTSPPFQYVQALGPGGGGSAASPQPQIPTLGTAIPGVQTPMGGSVWSMGQTVTIGNQTYLRVQALGKMGEIVYGTLQTNANGQREMIPDSKRWMERIPVDQSSRPSRLTLNAEQQQQAQQDFRELRRGQPEGVLRRTAQSIGRHSWEMTKTFGVATLFFYLALGMLAAFWTMAHMQWRPNAWYEFLETLNDPVGVAMLGGFVIASYPIFTMLNRPWAAPASRYFPIMGVGILSGTLVSQLINVVMQDPNARECAGLNTWTENFSTGRWIFRARNLEACDKAMDTWWESWADGTYMKFLIPEMSKLTLAAAIFIGIMNGAPKLLKVGSIARAVSRLNLAQVFRFGQGNPQKMAALLGSFVLFQLLYRGIRDFLPWRWMDESLMTDWSVATRSSQPYSFTGNASNRIYLNLGNTIGQTMGRIATTLPRAVDDKLQSGATLHLAALTDHLHSQLSNWREYQLKPAMDQMTDWSAALQHFEVFYGQTYSQYRDIANILATHNSKVASESNADPDEMLKLWLAKVSEINNRANNLHYPLSDFEFTPFWKIVTPRTLGEYIVLSTACGPYAEPHTVRGAGGTPVLRSGSVIGRNLLNDPQFLAPRIVRTRTDASICDSQYASQFAGLGINRFNNIQMTFNNFLIQGPPTVGEPVEAFPNLFEYLKHKISPEIVHGSTNTFDKWWKDVVFTPQVEPAYKQFHKSYQRILNTSFKQSIFREDYKCVSQRNLQIALSRQTFAAFVTPDICTKTGNTIENWTESAASYGAAPTPVAASTGEATDLAPAPTPAVPERGTPVARPPDAYSVARGIRNSVIQEMEFNFEILSMLPTYWKSRDGKPFEQQAIRGAPNAAENPKTKWEQFMKRMDEKLNGALAMIGTQDEMVAYVDQDEIDKEQNDLNQLRRDAINFLDNLRAEAQQPAANPVTFPNAPAVTPTQAAGTNPTASPITATAPAADAARATVKPEAADGNTTEAASPSANAPTLTLEQQVERSRLQKLKEAQDLQIILFSKSIINVSKIITELYGYRSRMNFLDPNTVDCAANPTRCVRNVRQIQPPPANSFTPQRR